MANKKAGGTAGLDPFRIGDWVIYIILGILAVLCLIPLANVIAISFSHTAAAEAGDVGFWPVRFTLASYKRILEDKIFFSAFGISTFRTVVATALSMVITFLMAYPLSREKKEFPMRGVYVWYLIVTMLFNGGLIPTYLVVVHIGLKNSLLALIIPYLVSSFNTILLVNFFRNLPREMHEAASIDGAGPWTILLKVFVPLSTPVAATLILFSVLWHWNDYFSGMIYIDNVQRQPLMTYIRSLTLEMNFDQLSADELVKRAEIGSLTYNSAKIVVAMVPMLVIYPFLQKYFVNGIMIGSVKG